MAALLAVRNLEARYGDTRVLRGITFEVAEGGITTILGANGAGKTTTLRAVCGMVKTAGEINFDGRRIEGRATEDVVRLGVAHVPEGRGTFVQLTVEENLRLGAYARLTPVTCPPRSNACAATSRCWPSAGPRSPARCRAASTAPIEQEQLAKSDGERWVLFGEIYDAGKK
jgi:ABC-type branched-subunit amino acid transport system ATPase component